jgi:protease-4
MGQFLKQTLASAIGTLAGLLLFLALGAGSLTLLLLTFAQKESAPALKERSILVFDLSTQIRDTRPPLALSQVLTQERTEQATLFQVLRTIETATGDDRIVGILLEGKGTDGDSDYAILSEVRQALAGFRAAGKKIVAYNVNWTESQYYLASVADTIAINPLGAMEFNGLSSQPVFFAGAFDKFGIGVQVVRAGNYKSAVEPFTRTSMSPENRQQLQSLLADRWGNILETVGASRQLTPQKLQKIADTQGILDPEAAKAAGLADRVAYYDQVAADLQKLTGEGDSGEKSFQQISLNDYFARIVNQEEDNAAKKVAIVYAEGTIVSGQGGIGQVGSTRFVQELREVGQDEKIKAVVVRVNSPGGSATASEVILRELQLLQQRKPVVVSMGNVAASGGYWIATGGQRIFAETSTITGSIGVFGLLFNVEKIAKNNGITSDRVKTGQLADINTLLRPKTPVELAIYQKYVAQTYNAFLKRVAKSRNLPPEKVAQIAQGRIWSGEAAQKIGLVDEVGGLETAVLEAAAKAKLGDDWKIVEYPAQRSLETEILARLFKSEVSAAAPSLDPLSREFLNWKNEMATLQSLNDPKGIYARLPWNWRVK